MPDAPADNPAPGFARKPDHVVAFRPAGKRVTVRLGGEVIAESDRAVLCEETGHGAVYYIPMADTRANLFRPTATRSYCPFKGEASYWSVSAGGAANLLGDMLHIWRHNSAAAAPPGGPATTSTGCGPSSGSGSSSNSDSGTAQTSGR